MKFSMELENAIKNEDFYEINEVLKKIKEEDDAFEYLSYIFTIMEANPMLDYGMPGPVVHFMESYYKKGYEGLLLESIKRNPINHTIWMLNRIVNDPNLENKDKYLDVMKELLNRDDVTHAVKEDIEEFLAFHECN